METSDRARLSQEEAASGTVSSHESDMEAASGIMASMSPAKAEAKTQSSHVTAADAAAAVGISITSISDAAKHEIEDKTKLKTGNVAVVSSQEETPDDSNLESAQANPTHIQASPSHESTGSGLDEGDSPAAGGLFGTGELTLRQEIEQKQETTS